MGKDESPLLGVVALSDDREELEEEDSPWSIGLIIWVLCW